MNERLLVLGGSSWIGSKILNKIKKREDVKLIATYYKNKIDFGKRVEVIKAIELNDYITILDTHKPTTIINLLRGEDNLGYRIHESVIKYCQVNNAYYVYASSVLALDNYEGIDLTEDLAANAKSEYGIFKARCEKALYDSKIRWTVLRFASIQGYCKFKLTRNEVFLQNLSRGERIFVDTGVVQNRLFDEDLADMITLIIEKSLLGIVHLGTFGNSDELDFLRKVALKFGYESSMVQESKISRNINLSCVPNKILTLIEKPEVFSENIVINKLFDIQEFRKYIKP